MYILIGGGGKVGFYLAQELVRGAHEVVIVERDHDRARAIAEELGEFVVEGDCCEAATLDEAGIARADLAVAVTGDDEDNLVFCEIARKRGAARMISRINNPKNELLFKQRGLETTISATQAILAQIEQELPTAELIPLLQLHSGLEIVEVKLPEISPAVDKTISNLWLPQESLILLVVDPAGLPRVPSGDTRLEAGDALVVVTRKDSVDRLMQTLVSGSGALDT
ncbi:MAG: TrkA family potassium uptake protein [Dehalococcoidia bacterium]|nr:TrkA family potassium uptake protein [Dehalococcoidia bacterium]